MLALLTVTVVSAEDLLGDLVLDDGGFLLFLLELTLEQAGVAVVEEVFQVVLLLGELLGDDAGDAGNRRVIVRLDGLQLPQRTVDGMGELWIGLIGVIRVIAQVMLKFGVRWVGTAVDHEGGGGVRLEEVVYEGNDCHDGGGGCEETEA